MVELLKDGVDEADEAEAMEAGQIIKMPTWEQKETEILNCAGWLGEEGTWRAVIGRGK